MHSERGKGSWCEASCQQHARTCLEHLDGRCWRPAPVVVAERRAWRLAAALRRRRWPVVGQGRGRRGWWPVVAGRRCRERRCGATT